MRKFITLLLVFVFSATAFNAMYAATYTTNKSSVISVDPVDLLFNTRISATYETKFGGPNNSLTISASYWGMDKYATAFGVGASYRWYIDLFEEGKKSLNGLSIGPRLDYYYWSWSWDVPYLEDISYSTFAIGAEINYKWVFSDKWSVEPSVKFVFPVNKKSGYAYTNYGAGVNLGYAF